MSERAWTEEQRAAIEQRGENLLVSAGAGSGKTAVLIERVVRRITDHEDPLDIDQLLVVTFTNAAAEEMRQRLAEALDQAIIKEPDNKHLLAQAGLLEQAYITTLHSFCLDLIRKNFYRLDLDAAFRVAGDLERRLLYREVLDDYLEEQYQKGDPLLPLLADCYGGNKDDSGLKALIREINEFALSQPYPGQWLQKAGSLFSSDSLEGYPWSGFWRQELKTKIAEVIETLEQAIVSPYFGDIPRAWRQSFAEERAGLLALCAATADLAALMDSLYDYQFERLSSAKNDPGEKEAKEYCRKLRDRAKQLFNKAKKQFFPRPSGELLSGLQALSQPMSGLKELVCGYNAALAKEKKRRGLIDYSDMEHFCLELLAEEANGVRAELQQSFREVLVDEYQDINGVQDRILQMVSGPHNSFMVGDIKQSIYGFRLAEPQLFLDKYQAYKSGCGGKKIDLRSNFRSSGSIIAAVNFIFGRLMTKEGAGVDYDDSARLRAGREEKGVLPEIYLFNYLTDKDRKDLAESKGEDGAPESPAEGAVTNGEPPFLPAEENAKIKLEARFIASKILQMRDEGYDFRDMAILLRSLKNKEDIYLKELAAYGIPVLNGDRPGSPAGSEVELMISLLQVIDNPLQDIALAAVLYSPLVGLSLDALLGLESAAAASLYQALVLYAAAEGGEGEKAAAFLVSLQSWRQKSREYAVSELLQLIFKESGFYHLAGALPGGAYRQKHLRDFYETAREYDRSSFKGLFRFLRMIEEARESGQEPGGGRQLAENENAVRLMSIHRSKGLEFPVVFLGGLGDNFNLRASNSDMVLHQDFLWGPKIAFREQRIKIPSLAYQAIAYQKRRQALAEEMRILYVAMTRAKERLIMSAAVRKLDEAVKKWAQSAAPDPEKLPWGAVAEDSRYIDWLGRALFCHGDAFALREALGEEREVALSATDSRFKIAILDSYGAPMPAKAGPNALKGAEAGAETAASPSLALANEIKDILDYCYPYGACDFPAKWTVTEAQKIDSDQKEPRDSRLLFGEEEDKPEREDILKRGILLHHILEKLDLKDAADSFAIDRQIESLCRQGYLSEEELSASDSGILYRFFDSDLGKRAQASPKALRELAFTFALPAGELAPDAAPCDSVILQGMIDLAFIENGAWVLVDYKTGGRNATEEELKNKYRLQLAYYRRALAGIFKAEVKEAYLFMLDDGRVIPL